MLDVERRIEDRLQLIVVALLEGLELVIVALGALHRHSQQGRSDDLHRAFQHGVLVGPDLVGIAVAGIGAVGTVAQEMRGHEQIDQFGRHRGFGPIAGQLVARQLLADELIERFVGVERANDIVAIAIGQRPIGIGEEVAVGVGIAGRVEPILAPALAVARRGKIALDHALVGVVGRVVEKGRNLLRCRRQANQIERHAANQRCPVGFGPQRQPGRFQFGFDEAIDRGAQRRLVLHVGNVDFRELLKGPVLVAIGLGWRVARQARCAGFDPAP